jgi:hypothetical protein
LGAEHRLEQLRQEEAAIRAAFPDLKNDGPRRGRRPGQRAGRSEGAAAPESAQAAAGAAQGNGRRRKRFKMSAAQKRAVSERMKKYWAARRKAGG